MAMAEVFVRKAALFGAEQESDTAGGEALAEERRGLLEAFDRMLWIAAADGGGADDEGAIRNCFSESLEFLSAGKQRRSAHGGARFPKCQLVGIYDAEMEEAKVAHGASGGADVERIARADEYDAQVIELGCGGHGTPYILRRAGEKGEYKSDEGWQNDRRE